MLVHEPKPATSGPQLATFSYFHFNPTIHTYEKPYEILINLPQATSSSNGYRRTNQEFEPYECVVKDVRGQEADFRLDQQGVCWRRWEGPDAWKGVNAEKVKSFGHGGIEETYLADVEEFIKQELEHENGQRVERVKVFDYKLRVSMDKSDFSKRTIDLEDGLDPMIPVTHPHVDQSFEGAIKRVHYHMKEEAPDLLRRRFRIINVWRPLKPVNSWPLAICDTSTVQSEDLIASDLVRRKFVGESFYARYKPNHRWYYLSDQQPDEVTMLKIYDSDANAKARFCLHSAFQYPGTGSEEVRESFEVRALVFDCLGD